MTTLAQIVIKDFINDKYTTSIKLIKRCGRYTILTTTIYYGNYKRYEETYTSYDTALERYIDDVKEFAEHTAYMNF